MRLLVFHFRLLCLIYPISLPMPLVGEPGSPYLDIGDAEDDVVNVKFFKDLEALFRRNAVIDEELKPITDICELEL